MLLNQDGRVALPCCPLCGEMAAPWFSGPNPPVNTANRGIIIMICGKAYHCDSECATGAPKFGLRPYRFVRPTSGCGRTWVYCYRCHERTDILVVPKQWVVVKVIP